MKEPKIIEIVAEMKAEQQNAGLEQTSTVSEEQAQEPIQELVLAGNAENLDKNTDQINSEELLRNIEIILNNIKNIDENVFKNTQANILKLLQKNTKLSDEQNNKLINTEHGQKIVDAIKGFVSGFIYNTDNVTPYLTGMYNNLLIDKLKKQIDNVFINHKNYNEIKFNGSVEELQKYVDFINLESKNLISENIDKLKEEYKSDAKKVELLTAIYDYSYRFFSSDAIKNFGELLAKNVILDNSIVDMWKGLFDGQKERTKNFRENNNNLKIKLIEESSKLVSEILNTATLGRSKAKSFDEAVKSFVYFVEKNNRSLDNYFKLLPYNNKQEKELITSAKEYSALANVERDLDNNSITRKANELWLNINKFIFNKVINEIKYLEQKKHFKVFKDILNELKTQLPIIQQKKEKMQNCQSEANKFISDIINKVYQDNSNKKEFRESVLKFCNFVKENKDFISRYNLILLEDYIKTKNIGQPRDVIDINSNFINIMNAAVQYVNDSLTHKQKSDCNAITKIAYRLWDDVNDKNQYLTSNTRKTYQVPAGLHQEVDAKIQAHTEEKKAVERLNENLNSNNVDYSYFS